MSYTERSKSAGKKPKEKSDKTKADNFVWTDDEVQLLLEGTNDYKVSTGSRASQSTLTFLNYSFPVYRLLHNSIECSQLCLK